jgi:hypothetical protein
VIAMKEMEPSELAGILDFLRSAERVRRAREAESVG